MIRFIVGEKGTGKTKRLIEEANNAVSDVLGHVLYIDSSRRYICKLNHQIRFADTSEFEIDTFSMFYGFICGIISENFDISRVYIDCIFKIVEADSLDEFEIFINNINKISNKFNIDFVIAATGNPEKAPDFLKQYIA